MKRLFPFFAALLAVQAAAAPLPPSPYEWLLRPLPALQNLGRYLPTDYHCPAPSTPLAQQLTQVTQEQGCGNSVGPIVYFPNPDVAYSSQPATLHGGFDVLADHIRAARQEVLLSNMFWNDGPDYPGRVLAQAIADLRRQVAQHPADYPRGVVVRIALGNGVGQGGLDLDPLRALVGLLSSLKAAGVPLPGQADTVSGFYLEVSNWPYLMPHSHVKLLIIDGQTVLVGGYNVTAQHLPPALPGSENVHDLALTLTGPAARQAAAAFDDLWQNSRRVNCTLQPTQAGSEFYCPPGSLNSALSTVPTHTWLSDTVPTGTQWALPLYRRNGFYEGDTVITTLLGSPQRTLDLMQSQVSGTFGCTLTWGAAEGCIFPQDALPMWKAVIDAITQRHIHVRLLIDKDPGLFAVETTAFVHAMRTYLKAEGLSEYFEVRYFNSGRQHTKAIVVDDTVAELGSYNLHYSSEGPLGLNEYGIITDDAATVSALRQQFAYEWAKSTAVALPWRLGGGG